MQNRTTTVITALLVVMAMLAVACGDDGGDADGADAATTTPPSSSDDGTGDDGTNDDGTGDDGTGDDGDDDGAPTTPSVDPAELTASWRGVTEDTIRLGFIYTDYDELRELGFANIDPGDPELVLEALIDDLNARGGVNGRMIEPYPEFVLPIGTTAAEESCLRLAEDNEVFAVIGSFGGLAIEANRCLGALNGIVQVGGSPSATQVAEAGVPWLSARMSAERRFPATVELFDGEGLIGERVAVAVTDSQREFADNLVIPTLAGLGHEVVELAISGSEDVGDTANARDEWDVFTERFDQSAIDTVILVESIAAPGSEALLQRGYTGQILIVDGTNVVGALGRTLNEDYPRAREIVGGTQATGAERLEAPGSAECVEAGSAFDPSIEVVAIEATPEGGREWFRSFADTCAGLAMFVAVATAAGADLTPDSFAEAATTIGAIELPFVNDASLGPGKGDASNTLRLSHYDPDLGTAGGATPVTDLVIID